MKKICSILLICLILNISFSSNTKVYSKTENTVYAKALTNCVLYKSQDLNDNIDNVYFIIPESYFVVVLETVNDGCYKVQYGKYFGYVYSSSVIIATFIPIVKTLDNITCDVKQTAGTQIWNKPSTTGNVLTTIPAGTLKISYISYCYGDIPIGGDGNIWYYVTYTPIANSTNVYEGYVYSENITNLSEILINTESNPEIMVEENNVEENNIYISSTIKTVVTSLISIPIIILFAIIMYKIVKYFKESTNKRKNNYFDKNVNKYTNQSYNSDLNEENSYQNNNLKNQINKLSNTSFIRQSNKNLNNSAYPQFPSYDADDDLL